MLLTEKELLLNITTNKITLNYRIEIDESSHLIRIWRDVQK